MRWDRFFDDLEDQLASEWEAERAALDTEAERLRLSRMPLRERLIHLVGREDGGPVVALEFGDGSSVRGAVTGVGADCAAVRPVEGPSAALVVPFSAIAGLGLASEEMLRSARPAAQRSALADRLSFGYVLRDLVRRRAGVAVHLLNGRTLTGTIDRAGSDHLDLALHDAGAARRTDAVTGYRVLPFTAVAWVRVDGAGSVL
ncbi:MULTISPECIES: hypothetical protein [Microbacterium]|uniref:hypothetical protein n=1 Tax=Microbacterium TaxID=33882 RepID=UPI00146E46D1|nr:MULTISPECIES: hypothetical protein [Microbacterium]